MKHAVLLEKIMYENIKVRGGSQVNAYMKLAYWQFRVNLFFLENTLKFKWKIRKSVTRIMKKYVFQKAWLDVVELPSRKTHDVQNFLVRLDKQHIIAINKLIGTTRFWKQNGECPFYLRKNKEKEEILTKTNGGEW